MSTETVSEPRPTPLYDLHVSRGGRMTNFAGSLLPTFYDGRGAIVEHTHTRAKSSWFDVSHMLACDVLGADAGEQLELLTPSRLSDLEVGQSRYCVLTNAEGGCVDDTIATRIDGGYRLVLNAGCAVTDVEHLRSHLGDRVQPRHDLGIVAVQGPASVDVLAFLGESVRALSFMECTNVNWNGVNVQVSRSGYTGEDGFELLAPRDSLVALSEAVLSHVDAEPAGLAARDSLRLEAALCLYGSDLSQTISPIEAGLIWTIPADRRSGGAYLGASVISAQIAAGPTRRLVAVSANGKRPIRGGAVLRSVDGVDVGVITSGGWGPSIDRPVAMGFVASGHHQVGTQLVADVRGQSEPCVVSAKPFVPHTYVRNAAK